MTALERDTAFGRDYQITYRYTDRLRYALERLDHTDRLRPHRSRTLQNVNSYYTKGAPHLLSTISQRQPCAPGAEPLKQCISLRTMCGPITYARSSGLYKHRRIALPNKVNSLKLD